MYRVRRTHSPNKLRDANIAIAYHNTGETLKSVGALFGVSQERVRQIHSIHTRFVNHCNGSPFPFGFHLKKNHNETMARFLEEYKQFLIDQGITQ